MTGRNHSARRHLIIGFCGVLVLVGVLGVWGTLARISGAVIATGTVEVESNRQVVEHDQGGIISEIFVRDGDVVAAGEALISLDHSQLQSELQIVEGQLFELLARKGRLIAERDESVTIGWDDSLVGVEIGDLKSSQQSLLEVRSANLQAEVDQIAEQVVQFDAQAAGIEAQLASLEIQGSLIEEELLDAQSLFDRGLSQASRVKALQREQARIIGEIGRLEAETAQVKTQQAELRISELRLRNTRREEAMTQLRDMEPRILELSERRLIIKERLSRAVISAPTDGIIYGSQVFARQSVIQAAEPIMYIVPAGQELVVAARIDAVHIDQVSVGQQASLRFSTFDQRFTPELFGSVKTISADVFVDETTGQQFYEAELVPNDGELEKLGENQLIPGLPVEVFVQTGERSPLHYLTKPLTDYFARAWREA